MDDECQATDEARKTNAVPCTRAVHANPDAPATAEQKPPPAALSKKPLEQKSPAEWAHERLILYIQNFEEQLDDEHEIAWVSPLARRGFCESKELVFSTLIS